MDKIIIEIDHPSLNKEATVEPIYSNYSPTFLYVDKYRFPPKWINDAHQVPYCMVRYICSGSARFVVDGESYVVKQDDVFYVPQGCHLHCAALEEVVFISVRFIGSIQLQDVDMLKKLWNITQQYNFAYEPQMREWFESLYHSAISRTTYKRLETRGYLNMICARLARESSKNEEPEETLQAEREMMESMEDMKYIRRRAVASHNKTDPRIQALVDYITLHPEANLTREEMCQMCDVSESTLRRLFKAHMGKSIYEFIKDTKILYASHLLMTTNAPISEIGYQLGYESPSYFTKTFREVFGISPQEYRKCSREA